MRRTSVSASTVALCLTVLLGGAGSSVGVLGAQETVGVGARHTWVITQDSFVDLWFHALAVVGYHGYGPLDLYDSDYAERARDAKARARISTTLDRRAAEFRKAFEADSAFEALHFLPLYFVGQEPASVLFALETSVRGAARGSSRGTFASTVQLVSDAFPTARERAVLASFIDAMREEWTSFLREDRASRSTSDRRMLWEQQSAWNDRFAPSLAGFFSTIGVSRGTIALSPAVGSEGRIVRTGGGAVIVVVSTGAAGANTPLLYAVRELAFPLLDQLSLSNPAQTPRVAAARRRDAAAVRAGAFVLDAIDNSLAAEYRRLFVDAIGGRVFEQAYPLSTTAELELRQLAISAAHGAASGRSSNENR